LNNESVVSMCSYNEFVYAGTSIGNIFMSSDYGQNWIQTASVGQSILSLMKDGNNIYAGTAGTYGSGIYISSNNGLNWIKYLNEDEAVVTILKNNDKIYAGCGSGVYISTNNGETFFQTLHTNGIRNFAISNNILYGCGNIGTIYSSTNAGLNWQSLATLSFSTYSIVVNNQNIYAGCSDYGGI
jgi:hypothetical protein